MWDRDTASGQMPLDGGTQAHLDTEIGWGPRTWGGRAILTPTAGLGQSSDGGQVFRLGARLNVTSGLELSLEGERVARGDGDPELGLALRGRVVW